jgi:NitT/TauT family transport system ATP-binding protein
MSVVKIDNVTKEFRGGTVALKDVSLEIEAGEFISLIGPSGCGKSTLLRIIGDLIEPTHGMATVNGKPVRQARKDRDYGIVFQDPVLYDWRTVGRNIALPLELAGWSRQKRAERVKEMLALVELSGFDRHHPWQLSGGMQQRASICRALIHEPKLLMLDEPFGALDAFTREELWCVLRDLWEAQRFTVVLVTHDLREAVFLADTVYCMSKRPGRIIVRRDIDLPRPRDLEITYEDRFTAIVHELREHIGRVRKT